jgi:hypothetical protein
MHPSGVYLMFTQAGADLFAYSMAAFVRITDSSRTSRHVRFALVGDIANRYRSSRLLPWGGSLNGTVASMIQFLQSEQQEVNVFAIFRSP